ncbi:cellulase family glycosylhydrolase [Parabacteroides timonensis]|uniref:cellulase family glycosylhydrolase n=1 Tax=Parabacteroides timonensis TaxID=1871013 RepID=UPI00094E04C9|nr:cellulase family glycosylhydrolase [Parabacteroides timonensis]
MKKSILLRLFIIVCLLTGYWGMFGVQSIKADINQLPEHNKDVYDEFIPIYSSLFGKINSLSTSDNWGQTTILSEFEIQGGNNILKLESFNTQPISFYEDAFLRSVVTHINVDLFVEQEINSLDVRLFAPRDENVTLQYVTGPLSAGKWHTLQIPLVDFRLLAGEKEPVKITSLQFGLSGNEVGTTTFLDNIYFFKEKGIEAAPIPGYQSSNVINVYSTKYGTDTDFQYLAWGWGDFNNVTQKGKTYDTEGKPVLKFTDFSLMALQYNQNDCLLDISGKDRLSLVVCPETDIDLLVRPILYKRHAGTQADVGHTYGPYSLSANVWTTIDIDLSDYYTQTGDKLSVSVLQLFLEGDLVNISPSTFYTNHIYFYNSNDVIVESAPDFAAYLPPVRKAKDVLSVFGDSYIDNDSKIDEVTFVTDSDGDQTTDPQAAFIGNREVKALINMNHIPIEVSETNVSIMDYFHIDVYSEVEANLTVDLIGVGDDKGGQTHTLSAGKWTRIDMPNPVSGTLRVVNLTISENGKGKNIFIDNMYFYKKQRPFTPTNLAFFNRQLSRGVNIGATYEQNPDYAWSDTYIQKIKAKGFKHVRLPVRWDNYPTGNYRSLEEAPYNIKAEFLAEIQTVIDKLLAADLKVILNMHHYDPLMDLSDTEQEKEIERFLALWGQLADYFQNYDERLIFEILNEPRDNMDSKWNEVFPEAIATIRQGTEFRNDNNKNRVIMVGTTNWGTIYGLEGENALKLPENDDRLIVTIHYYNPLPFTHQGAEWVNPMYPVGLRWNDTQKERDAVTADFKKVRAFSQKNNNVPIHIGEFGVHEKADIDSRLLWTNHVARTIESYGFSFAYWHLTSSIYNTSKGYYPYLPDALLTYNMPAKAAEIKFLDEKTIYDSNDSKGKNWAVYKGEGGQVGSTQSDGVLTINIVDGGSETYSVQALLEGLSIEKNATYEVSFTTKSTAGGSVSFSTYVGLNGKPYTQYGSLSFIPGTTEQTFSYTFTMHNETNNSARMAFDLGKGGATTITLKDITIKKVIEVIPQAPMPSKDAEETISIFSTKYAPDLYDPANNSALDTNNKRIILFSGFESQELPFAEISSGGRQMLHMEIYPGSWFDITIVAARGGTVSVTKSYKLNPHTWNSLDIDLTDLFSRTGGKIKSIKLSGGTGEERRVYLDHIYLYQKASVPDPDPEEEAKPLSPAPTPTAVQGDVISIFSDSYKDVPSSLDKVDGQTTVIDTITIDGISTWKLTNTNMMRLYVGSLDMSSMKYLHLDTWSPDTGILNVYLSDAVNKSGVISVSVEKEKWKTTQTLLSNLSGTFDMKNIKYIWIESRVEGTFYLDNLYFSKNQTTGNENIHNEGIVYKLSNEYLVIEATAPVSCIEIFDVSGRLIKKELPMTHVGTVDIHSMSKGVYVTQVVCSNGNRKTFKFIKK